MSLKIIEQILIPYIYITLINMTCLPAMNLLVTASIFILIPVTAIAVINVVNTDEEIPEPYTFSKKNNNEVNKATDIEQGIDYNRYSNHLLKKLTEDYQKKHSALEIFRQKCDDNDSNRLTNSLIKYKSLLNEITSRNTNYVFTEKQRALALHKVMSDPEDISEPTYNTTIESLKKLDKRLDNINTFSKWFSYSNAFSGGVVATLATCGTFHPAASFSVAGLSFMSAMLDLCLGLTDYNINSDIARLSTEAQNLKHLLYEVQPNNFDIDKADFDEAYKELLSLLDNESRVKLFKTSRSNYHENLVRLAFTPIKTIAALITGISGGGIIDHKYELIAPALKVAEGLTKFSYSKAVDNWKQKNKKSPKYNPFVDLSNVVNL